MVLDFHKIKQILSKALWDKDLNEASFVLWIEIHQDGSSSLLGLIQNAYIDRAIKRFNINSCSPGDASIVKGDKFCKPKCPKTDFEKEIMKQIPYASTVGSLNV